jgi:hypothetical protein
VIFGLVRVVIADARVGRHAVEKVAVRLEKREEPVIVFVTGVRADGQAEQPGPGVDVVASSDDQADVVRLADSVDRRGDRPLPPRRAFLADAGAVVAEADEGERA